MTVPSPRPTRPVTTVYGADGYVIVEGLINQRWQYEPDLTATDGDRRSVLAFSDGTVLAVAFDGDIWRITPVARGQNELVIERHRGPHAGSDEAAIFGELTWALYGRNLGTREDQDRDE